MSLVGFHKHLKLITMIHLKYIYDGVCNFPNF